MADQVTPVIYEAAATGDSFTSVADADLLGSEAPVVLAAAGSSKVGYVNFIKNVNYDPIEGDVIHIINQTELNKTPIDIGTLEQSIPR